MKGYIPRRLLFFDYFFYSLLGGLLFFFTLQSETNKAAQSKVLICGVGKNIAFAVDNMRTNIEALGDRFKNYAVLIYEDNSSDQTAPLLKKWAKENSRVTVISETFDEDNSYRTIKIANARNHVLNLAKHKKYRHFDYIIMVDLDFITVL